MIPEGSGSQEMTERNVPCVLVTGGCGFIGRSVCRLLQRKGYRALALDQSVSANALAAGRPWREIQCDICDPAQLQRVFAAEKIGGIVHLAAILPTAAQRDPWRATQVNLVGSLNLLEMARQYAVRRFVFGSSLSVYGSYPADERVAETHRAAPQDLYGAAKIYIEQLGAACRTHHGLEFVTLRIGRVVGPGARSLTSAWRSQIFEELQSSQPTEILLPYVSSERILLVHVEDVAKMLVTLLHAPTTVHLLYNACCESVLVSDLQREVQSLNPNIQIKLGCEAVVGNPRLLDATRFQQEFHFQTLPIFEQLRNAAGEHKTAKNARAAPRIVPR
jgi:nucleoside-diphosphate-sugar epimerase